MFDKLFRRLERELTGEPPPRIHIADLKRLGVLQRPAPLRWAKVGGLTFEVGSRIVDNELVVGFVINDDDVESGFTVLEVQVGFFNLTYGPRKCFVCPSSGVNCYTLFYDVGELVSRRAYVDRFRNRRTPQIKFDQIKGILARLEGTDGRGRSRGWPRKRAIHRLRTHPDRRNYPPAAQFLKEEDAREAALAARKASKRPAENLLSLNLEMSTRRYISSALLREHAQLTPDQLEAISQSDVSIPPDRNWAVLEDHARLDVREVLGWWESNDKVVSAHDVICPALAKEDLAMVLILDKSQAERPFLMVHLRSGERRLPSPQLIHIRKPTSSRPRWNLVCPVTHSCHDILFLRDGLFASRKAQRLKHRGQLGASQSQGTSGSAL